MSSSQGGKDRGERAGMGAAVLPEGVSGLVEEVLTSRNAYVIAAYYEVLSKDLLGRCRWYAHEHAWKVGSVLSRNGRVREISHICRRCGVAFSLDADGRTQRWQVSS